MNENNAVCLSEKLFENFPENKKIVSLAIITTGLDAASDRILKLTAVLFNKQRKPQTVEILFNPCVKIPAEVTAVHGITDEDIADSMLFSDLVENIAEILRGAVIFGFHLDFQLGFLAEEFKRAEVDFPIDENTDRIDPYVIFAHKESYIIDAAYRKYVWNDGAKITDSWDAAVASVRIFLGQIRAYREIPNTLHQAAEYCATVRKETLYSVQLSLFDELIDL